jgi:hypothetical protein
MRSAFGIEHGVVSKARNDHRSALGGTAVGAGAATAATGLAVGGVPGLRSNPHGVKNENPGKAARVFRSDPSGNPGMIRSAPGGVMGYRTKAHAHFNTELKTEQAKHAHTKGLSRTQHFLRGRGTGKIGPEEEVIRHLKVGRKAGIAALAGGVGLAAYGAQRSKVKKSERTDKYSGAALGAGATTAGVGIGGKALLGSQGKKWYARSQQSVKQAGELVPGLAHKTRPVGDYDKELSHKGKARKIFTGTTNAKAAEAGKLHGAASQQRYFAMAYGKNAKMVGRATKPGLAVAGLGAAGLAAGEAHRKWKASHG